MTKITPLMFVAPVLALGLSLAPAHAQQTRTWVSGTGTDLNPGCFRVTPCKTFAGALSKTAAGGIINCIDAGEFGPVTIFTSITIDCTGTAARILVPPGGAGIQVNAAATDIVTLRGLSIEGVGTGGSGVLAANGTTVHIENCKISGFHFSDGGTGIFYAPPSGLGDLHVSDTTVSDNFTGISIRGTGTGSANASINRVQVKNNSNVGILVFGSFSTGVAINVNVRESVVTGNENQGIVAITSAGRAGVTVLIDRTTSSFNAGSGVYVQGAAASGPGSAIVRIGNSVITQNVTGVLAVDAGVIRTYKVNEINDNLSDGTPITNQDALN